MAFPTTSILDAFTGANEDPIATGWSGIFVDGDTGQMALISNALTNATGGGTDTSSWYDLSTPGPDCETYITIATASVVAGDQCKLFARVINPSTPTFSGYELHVQKDSGTDIWRIRRRDSVVPTQLGADLFQEIASGDSIGLEIVAADISAYHKPAAGGWTLVGTRSDSTYSAAGVIGVK